MFGWWDAWRRSRVLRKPLAAGLREVGLSAWQWAYVPAAMQEQAVEWMRLFVAWRHWEGCQGLVLEESMKWSIASQAALMTLAYPDWHFDNVPTVLLYPDSYVAQEVSRPLSGDIAMVGDSARDGEAWYRGPVILNWRDVREGGASSNEGNQLVAHEFAHQMDMANSATADGVPPLPSGIDAQAWKGDFDAELALARDYTAAGHSVLINDYGLSSPGEFFAVASELYFQLPHALGHYHPSVYELLERFYQTDLRRWLPRQEWS